MKLERVAVLALVSSAAAQDLWCGKVYTAGEPEVIPEGWLYAPTKSSVPLLDVQVTPRHSIYVASEDTAEFIVDAGLSFYRGAPYESTPPDSTLKRNTAGAVEFTIQINGNEVVDGTVGLNTTNNLFSFPIQGLEPQIDGYTVKLTATSSGKTYTATTSFFYLPEKTTGSVVKVDNLYGSLLYRNAFTNDQFEYVFPYGFYGDCSGYFDVNSSNIEAYADQGFNAVNPVCAFTDGNLTSQFDTMDAVNVLFQYDMRGSYMNLTSVAEQVALVKDHSSLLTYYTADEPDGWEYALNSTTLAYDLLAELDKYHPVALVLNCQNYYFPEYTAGADIVMEDAYPVGINATYSYRGTPCNDTYGDCGCDNCLGTLTDVPSRIDSFNEYGEWIGGAAARKPVWEVPQAFDGEGYWSRDPTADEVWAMDIMAFNHGATGRLAWIYPATDELNEAAAELAVVVTEKPVVNFLTQANPVLLQSATEGGELDAAYWLFGGKTLVGIVNPNNVTLSSVKIDIPAGSGRSQVESVVWGATKWTVEKGVLTSQGSFPAIGTSYVILE
ncbi:hypothetical protein BX600DRAFT_513578 [Xylariales sp. PMI_506]|nr:hypothetical protein BX600DRAFT_513578 [Xylariales sp. PMI_506]